MSLLVRLFKATFKIAYSESYTKKENSVLNYPNTQIDTDIGHT